MEQALALRDLLSERNRRFASVFQNLGPRLRAFIRRRIPDEAEAEDLLQEVFSEFWEATLLTRPLEQASAWLYRVARNRIIDLFRKKKPLLLSGPAASDQEEGPTLEDLLPSKDRGPETAWIRSLLMEELSEALDELSEEQREVFVAHEIQGRSFKEMAMDTGLSVNTLLGRKHAAVLHLRSRLAEIRAVFNGEGGES